MSKPTTRDKMLDFMFGVSVGPGQKEIFDAICSLIESSDKGPEVDEEFVEKWRRNFDGRLSSPAKWEIIKLLREAGMQLKEEK